MSSGSISRADELKLLLSVETDDCVEWPYRNNFGYGQVNYGGRIWPASRLALVLATGVDDPALEAAHGPCHNRACVNTRHLSWKTPSENMQDRKRDGTNRRHAKLTETDVLEIRASGEKLQALADRYGVTPANISAIRHRKSWADL